MSVPRSRVLLANDRPERPDGRWVVYWASATRRVGWNFGLQYAADRAEALGRPLVVLEALSCSYPHASRRHHAFALEGMAENARRLAGRGVTVHSYAERAPGEGRGLHEAWGREACLVVTDHWPCEPVRGWVEVVARRSPVRVVAVDSAGLLPVAATPRAFPTAHALRRFLQRELPEHLGQVPLPDPLAGRRLAPPVELPEEIARRWPAADLSDPRALAARLPVDAEPGLAPDRGGSAAAEQRLEAFLDVRLDRYLERNQPDADAASGLSPWLHFGHLSPHEVLHRLARREGWSPADLQAGGRGARQGWWSLPEPVESFLDELVTWRELGLNNGHHDPLGAVTYQGLPDWARRTLAEHAADPRPGRIDLERLDAAATDDPLWNAAQTQLVREGRLHNYLRMLWGKKVLGWAPDPQQAFEWLVHLNNRYALDGRDPNSYSGITWVFGRYDRAWGPERPIFGKVRYMTSENTARKLRLADYLERYGSVPQGRLPL